MKGPQLKHGKLKKETFSSSRPLLDRFRVSMNLREFNTVVAALRLWQRPQAHIADFDGQILALSEDHGGEALTNEEIDKLIERVNQ